jgi:hypothetical protein
MVAGMKSGQVSLTGVGQIDRWCVTWHDCVTPGPAVA